MTLAGMSQMQKCLGLMPNMAKDQCGLGANQTLPPFANGTGLGELGGALLSFFVFLFFSLLTHPISHILSRLCPDPIKTLYRTYPWTLGL